MTQRHNDQKSETEANTKNNEIIDLLTEKRKGYRYQPNNKPLPEGGGASTAQDLHSHGRPEQESQSLITQIKSDKKSLLIQLGRKLVVPDTKAKEVVWTVAAGVSAILSTWLIIGVLEITFFLPDTLIILLLAILVAIAGMTASGPLLYRVLTWRTKDRINSEQEMLAAELYTSDDGQVTTTLTTSCQPEMIKNVYESLGAPCALKEIEYSPADLLDLAVDSIDDKQLYMTEIETKEKRRGDSLIGSRDEQLLESTENPNLLLDQIAATFGEEGSTTDSARYFVQIVVSPRRHDRRKSVKYQDKYSSEDQHINTGNADGTNEPKSSETRKSLWASITNDKERAQAHARTKAEYNFNIAVRVLAAIDEGATHNINQKFDTIEEKVEAQLHHTNVTTSTRITPDDDIPFIDQLLNRDPRKELLRRFADQTVSQRPLTIGAKLHPKRKAGLIDDQRNILSYMLLTSQTTPKTGRVTDARPRDQAGKERPSEESMEAYRSDNNDPYGWNIVLSDDEEEDE